MTIQSSSGGLALIGYLLLGLALVVIGGAILMALFRRSVRRSEPEAERFGNVKDQIIWRTMAGGSRVTAAEVAAQSGLSEADAELALMALVSEGRAVAEASEAGVVYRIESSATGSANS